MTRWILLAITLFGFALAYVSKHPGLVWLGLILGFVGLFGMVFSIAADRVSAGARPESAMLGPEDLAAMRARRAASARPPAPTAPPTNPPLNTPQ